MELEGERTEIKNETPSTERSTDVAQKPKDKRSKILNYVKRKTLNKIQLGNLEKESNYYGLGVDYALSKKLLFSIDITAEIDTKVSRYITAQQAFLNFIYKQ